MAGNPAKLVQTGVGRSLMWFPDYIDNPFNVSIGCVTIGTVTYNIEHTFEDPTELVLVSPWAVAAGTKLTFPKVPPSPAMFVGRPVTDLTTPAAISGGTTVAAFDANIVTLSGALASGVVANDQISFLSWFANSGLTAATGNANGNYAFPVRAISINITAGTGTVIAELAQSSTP